MKIGVLGMQGAFIEHMNALKKCGVETAIIRNQKELDSVNGLIIPGGESTVIGKLIEVLNIKDKLRTMIQEGLPVWGTCAGMIILAKSIENSDVMYVPVMDIEVVRNAYGRQLGSFFANKKILGIEGGSFPMVFIRAPYIKKAGKGVKVLANVDGKIVAAREKNILVTSFHPELKDDLRMHQYFLKMNVFE